MIVFFSGVNAALRIVATVFFLRFWATSREALFAFFAVAFLLLSVSPAMTSLADMSIEQDGWLLGFRLMAFALIIVGLFWANLRPRSDQRRN